MMKKVVLGATKHGRRVWDKVSGIIKSEPNVQGPKIRDVTAPEGPVSFTKTSRAAELISQKTGAPIRSTILTRFHARNVAPNLAQELRNSFQFRMQAGSFPIFGNYKGLSSRLSLFAFVTVGMASQSQLKDSEGHDAVLQNIRAIFKGKTSASTGNMNEDECENHMLDDFHFGPMIAKGCSAAVYQARRRVFNEETESNASDDIEQIELESMQSDEKSMPPEEFNTDSDIEMLDSEDSDIEVIDEAETESMAPLEFDADSDLEVIDDESNDDEAAEVAPESHEEQHEINVAAGLSQWNPFKGPTLSPNFDLAIKMMFNFEVESLAPRIWREMENELVPAKMANVQQQMGIWENGNRAKMKRLPPHPNIVDMRQAFVADVPELSSAFEQYPDALPERINPDGYGRNKTLFIIMKRYQMTLHEYLQQKEVPLHHSCLLLAQLLEAVIHMKSHNVAHRDLKGNNILVEEDEAGQPHLVVTDFGCCFRAGSFGLRVPYLTEETCRAGNGALMAPEIASATPGVNSWLDYQNSDLWAVGTLAYEIFGAANPFYRDRQGHRLDSATYTEDQLPALPAHVPRGLQVLVKQMLTKDPAQRPSPEQVADRLQLMLWAPVSWRDNRPCNITVRRWFLGLSAKAICHTAHQKQKSLDIETTLQTFLLSRICASEVEASLAFLQDCYKL